jgi:hypothetical protein
MPVVMSHIGRKHQKQHFSKGGADAAVNSSHNESRLSLYRRTRVETKDLKSVPNPLREWRQSAPWTQEDAQVEQDLIISRALPRCIRRG